MGRSWWSTTCHHLLDLGLAACTATGLDGGSGSASGPEDADMPTRDGIWLPTKYATMPPRSCPASASASYCFGANCSHGTLQPRRMTHSVPITGSLRGLPHPPDPDRAVDHPYLQFPEDAISLLGVFLRGDHARRHAGSRGERVALAGSAPLGRRGTVDGWLVRRPRLTSQRRSRLDHRTLRRLAFSPVRTGSTGPPLVDSRSSSACWSSRASWRPAGGAPALGRPCRRAGRVCAHLSLGVGGRHLRRTRGLPFQRPEVRRRGSGRQLDDEDRPAEPVGLDDGGDDRQASRR
jgi:hypothetical protein